MNINKDKFSAISYVLYYAKLYMDEEEKEEEIDIQQETFENVKENSESNIGVLSFNIPNTGGRLIHPIVMYLDTYGNEAINGWDGTALKLDETNKNYIFAPQVGAGMKDSANRFTGIVMGKDSG